MCFFMSDAEQMVFVLSRVHCINRPVLIVIIFINHLLRSHHGHVLFGYNRSKAEENPTKIRPWTGSIKERQSIRRPVTGMSGRSVGLSIEAAISTLLKGKYACCEKA